MKNVAIISTMVLALFGAYAGFCFLFQWLWNEIAAGVFGAPELSIWQSVGLLVLIGILANAIRSAIGKG